MKVTFIEHSGFMVEMEQNVLLFDYYQGCFKKSSLLIYEWQRNTKFRYSNRKDAMSIPSRRMLKKLLNTYEID